MAEARSGMSVELIESFSKLQQLSYDHNIRSVDLKSKLPMVVAVGEQSRGKSSVLESLVGRQFIPRGAGMVTRTPLLVQCVYDTKGCFVKGGSDEDSTWDSSGQSDDSSLDGRREDEYAVFQDPESKQKMAPLITDEEIMAEIERQTQVLAGKDGKNISPNPIIVDFHSPNVVPLTIVDLPGLTYVPAAGQKQSICQEIEDLALSYIKKPGTVIVVVASAEENVETIKTLSLARRCDPEGERTILVLTKPDLMDRGTDAYDLLSGKRTDVVPKLGVTLVKNRSKQDIDNNVTVEEIRRQEREFFQKHYGQYVELDTGLLERLGTCFLQKRLSDLLLSKIVCAIPEIRDFVIKEIQQCEDILVRIGKAVKIKTNDEALLAYLELVRKVVARATAQLDGSLVDIDAKSRVGGARIKGILEKEFPEKVAKINPLQGQNLDNIKLMIENAKGVKSKAFTPTRVISELLKRPVTQMIRPARECIKACFDEMSKILLENSLSQDEDLKLYPELRRMLLKETAHFLKAPYEKADDWISKSIEMEVKHVNLSHPTVVLYIQHILGEFDKEEAASPFGKAGKPATFSSSATTAPAWGAGSSQSVVDKLWSWLKGKQVNASAVTSETVFARLASSDPEMTAVMIVGYFNFLAEHMRHVLVQTIQRHGVCEIEENLIGYLHAKGAEANKGSDLQAPSALLQMFAEEPKTATLRNDTNQKLKLLQTAEDVIFDMETRYCQD